MSAFNQKRNLQPLVGLSLHNRGAAHKSKARALSLSLVVGSQAPLGAGFGNLFPSAVGNSLGSSTLGGIASGLFDKKTKIQSVSPLLCFSLMKKKKMAPPPPPHSPHVLIAFNAVHLSSFFLPFVSSVVK